MAFKAKSHIRKNEFRSPNKPKAKDDVSPGLAAALDKATTNNKNAT